MLFQRVDEIPDYCTGVSGKILFVEWKGNHRVKVSAGAFAERVSQIAAALSTLFTPGDRVAVLHHETRVDLLAAEFSVIRLGGIVCPLSPADSASRTLQLIENVKPTLVIHDRAFKLGPVLTNAAFRTMPVPSQSDMTSPDLPSNNSVNIAIAVTTSGTSGSPKGVLLSHEAIVSTILSGIAVSPIARKERVISFLPLSHILERIMLYVAMVSGAEIHLAQNPQHGHRLLRRVHPHYFAAVPRILENVFARFKVAGEEQGFFKRVIFKWAMEQGRSDSKLRTRLANLIVLGNLKSTFGRSIKGIVVGGAGISNSIIRWYETAGIKVRQGYGMTEACGLVSINRFEAAGYNLESVGLPLPGVEVRISDPIFDNDGEIEVRSYGLLDGFLVDGVFAPAQLKDGWLRTGDLGHIDDDGFLFVTGRLRNTFKNSYAEFVTPEPIEQQLRAHPAIDQCMVLGNNRQFTGALILPDFAWLAQWSHLTNVHWTDDAFMVHNPDVRKLYDEILQEVNADLEAHERIGGFELVSDAWTAENGLLTDTLKLRREAIEEHCAKAIKAIYAGHSH